MIEYKCLIAVPTQGMDIYKLTCNAKNKSEALKQIHAYLKDESKSIGDNGKEYNILGCYVVDCEGETLKPIMPSLSDVVEVKAKCIYDDEDEF